MASKDCREGPQQTLGSFPNRSGGCRMLRRGGSKNLRRICVPQFLVSPEDREQEKQFTRTALWLVRESRRLRRMQPGEAHDRKAAEIMQRCESLTRELEKW